MIGYNPDSMTVETVLGGLGHKVHGVMEFVENTR